MVAAVRPLQSPSTTTNPNPLNRCLTAERQLNMVNKFQTEHGLGD